MRLASGLNGHLVGFLLRVEGQRLINNHRMRWTLFDIEAIHKSRHRNEEVAGRNIIPDA
jgi:hypothetical protein